MSNEDLNLSVQLTRRGTFFCRLEFLQIKKRMPKPVEFAEEFFLTNDQDAIDKFVSWDFLGLMGSLEFNYLKKAPVVAYRNLEKVTEGNEQKELINSLMILDHFENMFWLHSDCCVGHEAAFLSNGRTLSTNFFGGVRVCSDGSQKSIVLDEGDLHSLVKVFRENLRYDFGKVTKVHTKVNSNRLSRALDYVSRAQRSVNPAEKIAFYCTALEALFSTTATEIAHQISERVAILSSSSFEVRNERFWFLKKCYDTRSKFLHGSALKDSDAVEVLGRVPKLDQLVRDVFLSIFKDPKLIAALADDKLLDEFVMGRIFGKD